MDVWLGDRLVPAAEARISVFDRAFRSGEGIFETIRAYGTHPFRLDAHLERAERGASVLGFTLPDPDVLRTAIHETARANAREGDLALRLTVTPGPVEPGSPFPGTPTGGPTVVVIAHPLRIDPATYERGVSAATVTRTRELPEVKAVSFLAAGLARREATQRGADEALLVTPDGSVLEGSYSNVFAVLDGVLVTPPIDAGILPGVTRSVVLDVARDSGIEVEERLLALADVIAADEAFLTASTREVVPLVRIDADLVSGGMPGPVSRQLLAAYRDEVRREAAAG